MSFPAPSLFAATVVVALLAAGCVGPASPPLLGDEGAAEDQANGGVGGAGSGDRWRGWPNPPDDAPTEPYEVHLQVWAGSGPFTDEPLTIDRRLFSTNLWWYHGWYPEPEETWMTMLAAIRPGSLRWPAGHPGQSYCFESDSGEMFPGCEGRWLLRRSHVDAFVETSRAVGAEPLFAINVKTGTPEMAAALVRYANVEKGYDLRSWHLGNEPDLGFRMENVDGFVREWSRFSQAMRGVDDSIRLVGPELMTGVHVTGDKGRTDWIRPFLEANPGDVDAISWHLYPLDSDNPSEVAPSRPTVENLLQWWARDWPPSGIGFVDAASEKLRRDRDELMPGAEIWVTELGPDSGLTGAKGVTDAQVAAVWFADVLGRFAAGGTSAVFQFAFDHWSDADELSLVQRPPHGNHDPLPPWYTYWLFAEHWGDAVVRTNSTADAALSVHASARSEGSLAVLVVNKDTAPQVARLTLREMGPVARADVYALTAPSPTSLDARVNGGRIDPARFAESAASIQPETGPASTDAVWTFEPWSVTFIVFTRDG